jgi:hypothetical protein
VIARFGTGNCQAIKRMPSRLTDTQRQALEMLAGAPHGLTEMTMFAQGFAADMLAGARRACNGGDRDGEVGWSDH